MTPLSYKHNINTQNGEDGVIGFIFDHLGIDSGRFIEFGAWDGRHFSNCLHLLDRGWSGMYIEGDEQKYGDLVSGFGDNPRVTCVHRYVGFGEDDGLDSIIEASGLGGQEFDFVSIDVDGLDYHILKAFTRHTPKVICIEVNSGHSPTYPHEIPVEIAKNNVGQSLQVMCDLASERGYFPLCYTGNLFLVRDEYAEVFKDYIKPIESLYLDFLSHLSDSDLLYLHDLFVRRGEFNGFKFENPVLASYCATRSI